MKWLRRKKSSLQLGFSHSLAQEAHSSASAPSLQNQIDFEGGFLLQVFILSGGFHRKCLDFRRGQFVRNDLFQTYICALQLLFFSSFSHPLLHPFSLPPSRHLSLKMKLNFTLVLSAAALVVAAEAQNSSLPFQSKASKSE